MELIGAEVRREIERFGPAGTIGAIVEAWSKAVGESIARNAWPGRVARDGTLHVSTSSSAWAFELTQLAPTVLERLRERIPDASPSRLRFAPGPLPESSGPDPEARPPEPSIPSAEVLRTAEELAAEIADVELRTLVARAAAASLARSAADRSV